MTIPAPANTNDSYRILIVDDVLFDARLLEAILTSEGYDELEIEAYPRRVESRNAMRRRDAIFVDLRMPAP